MAFAKPGNSGGAQKVDVKVSRSIDAKPLKLPLITSIEGELKTGARPDGHPLRLLLDRSETLKLIEDLAAHLREIDGSTR